MTDELEDLFAEGETETPSEEETETPEETEEKTGEEPAEPEEGEEPEDGTPPSEPEEPKGEEPEDDSEEDQSWTKAMALDERRKRQALEEELKSLREKVESSETPEKAPDPYEDPEGYKEHLRSEIRAEYQKDMIARSRQKMMSERKDYADKEKVFMELVKDNPGLVDKMKQSWDPAQFAYDAAVDHLQQEEIRKAGGLEKWREAERERLKKELQAESSKKPKKEEEEVPSLATASSAASGHATPESDDLNDIVVGDKA